MPDSDQSITTLRHYFVDEAGDPSLFNKHGKTLIGKAGCSKFFMLGLADVEEPQIVAAELEALRQRLLTDPYFKGIPSFDPAQGKTALMFHAKDDLAEVRREVFSLLLKHRIRFYAVVRDKLAVLNRIVDHQKQRPAYRYHPNQLYDRCVSRLFKERLHKGSGYLIHFARRGSSDRTEALETALETSRRNLRATWGITATTPIEIKAAQPCEVTCLQVVDYYLWAIQRFFEQGEDRFLQLVWPQAGLIHDVDDTREAEYGVYYTQRKPLNSQSRA